jgi:23S rRNA U2552 (ribose-2'-O)-methylase RlmE/FtsJ
MLNGNGTLVMKVFRGAETPSLLKRLERIFQKVYT